MTHGRPPSVEPSTVLETVERLTERKDRPVFADEVANELDETDRTAEYHCLDLAACGELDTAQIEDPKTGKFKRAFEPCG